MNITIAGYSTIKTERTMANVEEALREVSLVADVSLANDPAKIARLGVHITPAVFVNERLRVTGRIPSVYELRKWIEEELEVELIA